MKGSISHRSRRQGSTSLSAAEYEGEGESKKSRKVIKVRKIADKKGKRKQQIKTLCRTDWSEIRNKV